MPNSLVPISLLVGVSSVVGLYYVEKQAKANMILAELEPDNDTVPDKMKKAKQLRLALMVSALLACLVLIYGLIKEKKAASSFESRVSNAASNLRSSMEHMGGPSSSSSIFPSANSSADTTDDFAARVSNAASKLRQQIAEHSSAEVFTPVGDTVTVPDLAAQASAEISQFIADNS